MEFRYVAKDRSGKTVRGRKMASSRKQLITELSRERLVIISLEETSAVKKSLKKMLTETSIGRGGRVKLFDLLIFCRQLATMLAGGVPILRAIESIASETKKRGFQKILYSIGRDLKDGKILSESLKKYPDAFSLLFITIVEAGEKVGSLDKMLGRLSNYLESRERLIRKMRSATTYPAFIALAFIAAMAVITIFLIPRFQSLYTSFGADLPTLTLAIFNISDFIIKNLAFVIIAFMLAVFSIFFFVRHTRRGRMMWDGAMMGLPIFGPIIKKAAVSKFCRTLSTLLDQGVAITDSLFLVGRTSGNILIEEASEKAGKLVMEGETIPKALEKMAVFPSLMLQMVSVGAEAGSMPELLDKTADFYEEQVDTFVSTLTAAIEPILVISLGMVIAVVVVAMYLPIFKLGTAMSGISGGQ